MLKNGTRVVKVRGEKGDVNPVGTLGTVKDSFPIPEDEWDADIDAKLGPVRSIYLVHWDGYPEEVLTAVVDRKIESHQGLKRMFKHGPKLTKKGFAA